MSNINPIEIFTGVNDVPVEATAEQGCNGSAIVSRVNKLVKKANFPFLTTDDTTDYFNRYLNTIAGNDNNDGLTPETAFLTWDRAIEEFRNGQLTDNYSTYLYVKGTLQCPLDCRGLYAMGDSGYNWGVIQIDKFPSETENFTIEGVTEEDIYISRRFAITEGYPFSMVIYNANININEQLDIGDLILYLEDCKAFILPETSYFAVVIGNANVTFNNLEVECSELKEFNISLGTANSILQINTSLIITGLSNPCTFNVNEGSKLVIDCDVTADYPINLWINSFSWLEYSITNAGWNIFENGGKTLIAGDAFPNTKSTALYIPSPGNGTYPIWHIHNTCKLKAIILAGDAGSGDFRTKVNSDYLHTAENYNFSSFENPQIKELNSEFYTGGLNTNKVYLEIANASNLSDLFIQLIYGTFN